MSVTKNMRLNYDPKMLSRELKLRQRSGAMIHSLVEASGLNRNKIWSQIEVSTQELSGWETGFRSPKLYKVADLLKICGSKAAVIFTVQFNALLKESHQRISELQSPKLQISKPVGSSALGVVGGIRLAG